MQNKLKVENKKIPIVFACNEHRKKTQIKSNFKVLLHDKSQMIWHFKL